LKIAEPYSGKAVGDTPDLNPGSIWRDNGQEFAVAEESDSQCGRISPVLLF
jgi:hypothetical protein